jgi:peptide/nickel transport system substrate-binding protein
MSRTFLRSTTWMLCAVLLLSACAGTPASPASSPGSSGQPKQGGTLVYGFDQLTEAFDPAVFTTWAGINSINNMFDTLVYSQDGRNFTPGLATAWKVSDDGLTYTFTLRPDVKFHDGTPFNAEAVKFSFDRQIDDKHPYHLPGMTQAALAFGSVKQVDVTGPLEVKVILKTPNAAQLNNLAIFSTGIVSPEAVKKFGNNFGTNPVGTGPFKFERLEKGQQIVLAANKDYWGQKPHLDRVIIRAIPEDSARKAALVTNAIDITSYLDFKDVADLKTNPNMSVTTVAANSTGYLALNAKNEALNKKAVRQAICTAVNRQNIIDVIFSGNAVKESGWMPPALFTYDKAAGAKTTYDVDKAKKALVDAGYPNGFALKLNVPAASHWPRMAELIQEDLRKVGVTVTINRLDPSAFGASINAGEHDMFLSDWTGVVLDPDYFMFSPFHSSSPRAKGRLSYANPAYDTLVEQALIKTNPDERQALYTQAQNLLLEDAPMCFLYYNQFVAAMNKKVHGFDLYATRNLYFNTVWID